MIDDSVDDRLTWVGRPMELVRVAGSEYLDQARADFSDYVSRTLAASQAVGGRFNPPGEFGALYTASDEATAWEEAAARFRRQGVSGLPPDMGTVRIVVTVGRFAALTEPEVRKAWNVAEAALTADDPTTEEREICWAVARSVRAVGDFLTSPSARASGANVPLFANREGGQLDLDFHAARPGGIPPHLAQVTSESW